MRQLRYLVLLLFIVAIAPRARAQQTVTLGNATAALTGPWKFHAGDEMAWAQPDFDDSAWGTMDLTPPPGSYDPMTGGSGFVSGWTARGYVGYSGYAWYRLRVQIQDTAQGANGRLAIKMPDDVDDAYQVYVNGRPIGEFGRFTAHGVTVFSAMPRVFPLPATLRSGPATVAIRMWMGASTPLMDQDAGGLHGAPVLGQESAITALLRLDWDIVNRSFYSAFLVMAILVLALAVAFGLFWLDPKEPAYLWLGITCADVLASVVLVTTATHTTRIDANFLFIVQDAVLAPTVIGVWVLFWAYWFRLGQLARLHRMVWSVVVLLGAGMAMLRAPLYGSVVPAHAIVWLSPLTLALKWLLGVLLVWVTVRGIRKDRTEGWLALPAVVLMAVSQYQDELDVLHVPAHFFPFGFAVNIAQIGTILSLIIITLLMLRRFLDGQREHARIRTELQQARQVQEMLIPRHVAPVPGFSIESVYLPAQEVGGDFFQAQPVGDGSLLLVVGDVSGKGLKAAMTVSTIVGALRNEKSREPAEILEHINGVLYGQIKGFATCCIALIATNGRAMIANAGHLAPYRNGEEIGLDNGLPLGIVADSVYEATQVQLAPGDRLTMLTDGVLEAMNAKRELFGFARVDGAMRGEMSATDIAAEAQAFGQQDDITVVRVTRSAKGVGELARESEFVAG
jgi:Stage II sporulation protein E (SpoIIE)